MNSKERDGRIKQMMEEDRELLLKKGHDYSGDGDSMSNLREFGFDGIIVRIGDKFHRLKNFVVSRKLKVVSETILDTLRDLRCYAYLAEILYKEANPDSSVLESTAQLRCHICGESFKPGDIYEKNKEGQLVHATKCKTTAIDCPRCYYCGGEFKDGDLCLEIEDGHICHVNCRGNQ